MATLRKQTDFFYMDDHLKIIRKPNQLYHACKSYDMFIHDKDELVINNDTS